ncbi:sulfurtransferase [Gryllotalpicola reticulitermitis]|uniref:Sulfurtransferase n=1 Tax=Gryllotalpicola reticulitermitis TaxID=1184153 RepID=A0ABV8Q3W8_9MICO
MSTHPREHGSRDDHRTATHRVAAVQRWPLTTPDELEAALRDGRYADGGPVRLLDVRWRLDRPDGRAEFEAGHVPGAVYVDLETELAVVPDQRRPEEGRHPLPAAADFEQSARSWGISDGDTVVVYDNAKSTSAARAWWLLRYAGVGDVRVLDGAFREWQSAGKPIVTGTAALPAPGDVKVEYGALPVIPLDGVLRFAESGVLIDARAGDRFRGENEPVDPRAGHIPGAVSLPTVTNVDERGRFLPASELRARFAELGVTDASAVGAYCGSGITAAHEAIALTLAGFDPAVFPGSFSQWSNHPELPVATGA